MIDQDKENEISSNAVMNFVNTMIGAFESGFTDRNTATLAEIYRIAQVHVKDNYKADVKSINDEWGPHTASLCMGPPPSPPKKPSPPKTRIIDTEVSRLTGET